MLWLVIVRPHHRNLPMDSKLFPLPTKDQYRAALTEILPKLSEPQVRMLRAHFQAPLATITTDDLALAAGFQNWKPVNMHYGLVGTALRNTLEDSGQVPGQQSSIMAHFLPPDDLHDRWRWVMHAPLHDALHELAWFNEELLGVDPDETLRIAALEGSVVKKLTIHRHRETALRLAKLTQARIQHPNGRLICEVPGCGFDFEATYGSVGAGYAEVHHLVPLATLSDESLTTLADLAVVCSNCHRMIHRGGQCRPLNSLLTQG